MVAESVPVFTVEEVAVGPYVHGFGRTADGNPYAFQVIHRKFVVEIYRRDLEHEAPEPGDVIAHAETGVSDIDLDDERSVVGTVRDLIAHAEPVHAAPVSLVPGETTVRALLSRIGSVIEGI